MFARTERLLLRPGWAEDAPALAAAIADEMIVRNLATAPWPYACAMPRPSSRNRAIRSSRRFLIFERTLRRAKAGRLLRAWPTPIGRSRARLLDRAALLGPRLSRPKRPRVDRHRPDARVRLSSKARTSSTIRPPAGCSRSLASSRLGITAPRMSCARGHGDPGAAASAAAGGRDWRRGGGAGRLRPRGGPSCAGRALQSRRRSPHRRASSWRSSSFHGWKPGRKNLNQAPAIFRNMPGRTHRYQSSRDQAARPVTPSWRISSSAPAVRSTTKLRVT